MASSEPGIAPKQLSLGDLIVSKLREKQREAGVSVLPRCDY